MKKTNRGHFLSSTPVSLKKGAVISFAIYLLLALLFINGGQEYVYNRVIYPILFHLRNKTSFAPAMHPKIKIYAVDQKTMNTVDQETIPLKDWTALLNSFAKSKPSAVFIDKAFMLTLTTDEKEIKEFRSALASLPKVVTGAYFTASPIQGLEELPADRLLKINSDWPPASKGYFYGPRAEIADAFTHIGHTNNSDFAYNDPIIRTEDGRAIPLWSLFAGTVNVLNNRIEVNGTEIPLDSKNRILANLASPDHYWKHTLSLRNILIKARDGKEIKGINSESIVVILTGMHAGGTTMKNTPAGTMPGGFIITEVINSVLTNNWIKHFGFELIFVLLFCLLGWASAVYLNTKTFWFTFVLTEISIAGFGIALFVFYNLVAPWAFPAAGFFFVAIAVFAERSRVAEAKAKALQYSLEGMVDSQKLDEIMKNPESFRFEPKSQVLTVMFIDIVGFSTMAEGESPAAVFARLREILGFAADIVHKSGGVIDRSLGDGLLCFFGYQFEANDSDQTNHAEAAINCASAIQLESLKRDYLAVEAGQMVFPLRIGINTGEVYSGDLGGGHKIDFTIIGHSVNFAQRLESACENYRVMCGPATINFLNPDSPMLKSISKKMINIKHHAELVEAFEFDPFLPNADDRQKLKTLTRKLDEAVRSEMRWPVNPKTEIQLAGSFGKGRITNYSNLGLEVDSDTYIGKGAVINFDFTTKDGTLEKELKLQGIAQINGEIRWSWRDGETIRLGILFKNLSPQSRELIFQYIREASLAKVN